MSRREGSRGPEYPWAPAWLDARSPTLGRGPHKASLIEIIDRLPPKQREVIEGLFWERVSNATLARRFGVTREAIRRRKTRAMANIRREMEDGP